MGGPTFFGSYFVDVAAYLLGGALANILTMLLKVPLALIAFTPKRGRQLLGWLIGLLWFDIFRVRRQQAIANVQLAFPKLSRAEATKVARKSLIHMGHNIIEIACFPFLNHRQVLGRVEFKNLDRLEKALEKGKGAFLLTAHIGNGDFATAAFSAKGLGMSLISKEFKSKWLNDFWFRVRESFGTQMIPPRKSSYHILKALKQGRTVIFVLDQYTAPPNGIVTEFFGKKTGTAFGLALLAQRSGAPVVPAYTYRTSYGQHVVEILDPLDFKEFPSSENPVQKNTQIYCDVVEQMIRNKPEQWMWVHRRWKGYWEETSQGESQYFAYPKY